MSIIETLIQQKSCGIYKPAMPAKYRVLNKQRQRLYRCVGCGERKWYDVEKRK